MKTYSQFSESIEQKFIPDAVVSKMKHQELRDAEVWLMSRDAYVKQIKATSLGRAKTWNVPIAKQLHKISVQKAVEAGKQVPAEVLKDYPELS